MSLHARLLRCKTKFTSPYHFSKSQSPIRQNLTEFLSCWDSQKLTKFPKGFPMFHAITSVLFNEYQVMSPLRTHFLGKFSIKQ